MRRYRLMILVYLTCVSSRCDANQVSVKELLDNYARNQEQFNSWILKGEQVVEARTLWGKETYESHETHAYDIRVDHVRVCIRYSRWGKLLERKETVPRDNAPYHTLLWDGKRYLNYTRSDSADLGYMSMNERLEQRDVAPLQYGHSYVCLFGHYSVGTNERIEAIIGGASAASVRPSTEEINGVECYVIDAQAKSGDYTIWIDPVHGYNIAQAKIIARRDRNHESFGKRLPNESTACELRSMRFERFSDYWFPVEAFWSREIRVAGATVEKESKHLTVTEFVIDPDHDSLGSFRPDDIRNGASAVKAGLMQIPYTWNDGELLPRISEQTIARIDGILRGMTLPDGNTPSAGERKDVNEPADAGDMQQEEPMQQPASSASTPPAAKQDPDTASSGVEPASQEKPRPHCGLYCLYSVLALSGRRVDFRELVKPEYLGSRQGSSLAELRRGAADYGLYTSIATRLTSRALRGCSSKAILHVKPNMRSKDYNHYLLFLGAEDGKAKVFDPPQPPRLADFKELACLWDDNALLLSDRSSGVDAVLAPDRQRLLFVGMGAVLVLLALHFAKGVWTGIAGVIQRGRLVRLTVVQAAILAMVALGSAVTYHLVNDEGLLANSMGTAGVQKAYGDSFLPRISEAKASQLLETGAVFIDARFSQDYKHAHIERAISLPVDTNEVLWKKTTATVPKTARIVVYCQSAKCKFAARVGAKLVEDGFGDVCVFRGGWVDWTRKHAEGVKGDGAKQEGDREKSV